MGVMEDYEQDEGAIHLLGDILATFFSYKIPNKSYDEGARLVLNSLQACGFVLIKDPDLEK